MRNSILAKTLHFLRHKRSYIQEERQVIKKALLQESKAILTRLVDQGEKD